MLHFQCPLYFKAIIDNFSQFSRNIICTNLYFKIKTIYSEDEKIELLHVSYIILPVILVAIISLHSIAFKKVNNLFAVDNNLHSECEKSVQLLCAINPMSFVKYV